MRLSIVVPLYNEHDNVEPLCKQIAVALDGVVEYEVVLVDDGSIDGTREALDSIARNHPRFRVLAHTYNAGQSAALCSGVLAARGALIATLDGDLQNDPLDIRRLLLTLESQEPGKRCLIVGNRARRNDSWLRRVSSRVANRVRDLLLHDHCPDTGCSLKLFRRDDFLLLPRFDHMHRFLPALFTRQGVEVLNIVVHHRPRVAGRSKYGVHDRLWAGIVDLFGVRWLLRRHLGID